MLPKTLLTVMYCICSVLAPTTDRIIRAPCSRRPPGITPGVPPGVPPGLLVTDESSQLFLYCSSCPHRPACIPPPPQDQCCLKIRGPAPRAFRGQKFATAKPQIFNIESGGVGGQMQICAFACIRVRRCNRCVSLNGGCELLSAYCLVFAFFSGILCCYVCRDGILRWTVARRMARWIARRRRHVEAYIYIYIYIYI